MQQYALNNRFTYKQAEFGSGSKRREATKGEGMAPSKFTGNDRTGEETFDCLSSYSRNFHAASMQNTPRDLHFASTGGTIKDAVTIVERDSDAYASRGGPGIDRGNDQSWTFRVAITMNFRQSMRA